MIEPDGPWGLKPKSFDKIKVLCALSDGVSKTAVEIADITGDSRESIIRILKGGSSVFSLEQGITAERKDNAGSKTMVTYYRWKLSLRPCPWCNQAPAIHKSGKDTSFRARIECKCGIKTEPFRTVSEAVLKWNKRFGE